MMSKANEFLHLVSNIGQFHSVFMSTDCRRLSSLYGLAFPPCVRISKHAEMCGVVRFRVPPRTLGSCCCPAFLAPVVHARLRAVCTREGGEGSPDSKPFPSAAHVAAPSRPHKINVRNQPY